ncbi:hypothetical protein TNCV_3993731 [Trichonephila clavipes]|uniref:Uncharacterized protein n=1 Tax=Trichonephila clavipes TaxID=2585209 RepID=A0A8X6SWJ4_TRICX|nr:hypothetical protein TNCV_3993731 [Trichonephila clavipes]
MVSIISAIPSDDGGASEPKRDQLGKYLLIGMAAEQLEMHDTMVIAVTGVTVTLGPLVETHKGGVIADQTITLSSFSANHYFLGALYGHGSTIPANIIKS